MRARDTVSPNKTTAPIRKTQHLVVELSAEELDCGFREVSCEKQSGVETLYFELEDRSRPSIAAF